MLFRSSCNNSTCEVNPGYYCTLDLNNTQACFEICGDGKHLGLNECDDGNTVNRDGCSHNCTIETGYVCEAIVEA